MPQTPLGYRASCSLIVAIGAKPPTSICSAQVAAAHAVAAKRGPPEPCLSGVEATEGSSAATSYSMSSRHTAERSRSGVFDSFCEQKEGRLVLCGYKEPGHSASVVVG